MWIWLDACIKMAGVFNTAKYLCEQKAEFNAYPREILHDLVCDSLKTSLLLEGALPEDEIIYLVESFGEITPEMLVALRPSQIGGLLNRLPQLIKTKALLMQACRFILPPSIGAFKFLIEICRFVVDAPLWVVIVNFFQNRRFELTEAFFNAMSLVVDEGRQPQKIVAIAIMFSHDPSVLRKISAYHPELMGCYYKDKGAGEALTAYQYAESIGRAELVPWGHRHNPGDDRVAVGDAAVSGYKFLIEVGYTREEIQVLTRPMEDDVEAARHSPGLFPVVHSWLEGQITSQAPELNQVRNDMGVPTYVWVPDIPDVPGIERFREIDKFSEVGTGIKVLKLDPCLELQVAFGANSARSLAVIGELKLAHCKERLLYATIDSDSRARLIVAVKYLPQGLHEDHHLASLRESARSGKVINITFQRDVVEAVSIDNMAL